MSSRTSFAALASALTIMVACILWFTRDPGAQPVSPEGHAPEERITEEIEGDRTEESRDALAESENAAARETEDATLKPPVEAELHHIRGQVVDEESGAPLEGCTVYFDNMQVESTDSLGAFELYLPKADFKLGTFHSLGVICDGISVFLGSLPLELEITVRVPPRLLLRGRLVCNSELEYESITMMARVPASGTQDAELYAGLTKLDAEGRFEVLISAPVPTREYHLFFGDTRSSIVDATLPVAILTEGDGPTIEAKVTRVTLRVQNADGARIKGVDVRIMPINGAFLPRWTVISTPENGEFDFLLADGLYELCAGHTEFLAIVREFTLPAEPSIVLTLESIEDIPGVRAQVLSPQGDPLENALITVAPKTQNADASAAGSVQRRTDAEGFALLPVAQALPYDWAAYDKRFGMLERDEVVAGTGTVVLRFSAIGGLQVVPRGSHSLGAPAPGPMQWILSERGGLGGASGQSRLSPFQIDELDPGSYDLFLYAADGLAYGEATVRVRVGETERVEVQLDTGGVLRGRVEDAAGNAVTALDLFLAHPTWPDRASRAWGRLTTDNDGRFEFRTGNRHELGVVAVREGTVLFELNGLSTSSEHILTVP